MTCTGTRTCMNTFEAELFQPPSTLQYIGVLSNLVTKAGSLDLVRCG